MERHKFSSKTIETIGDDLFEQCVTNKDWLRELTSMMASVIIGDDKNEVPLFADNSETLDIRCELGGYISEKFLKLLLKNPEEVIFTMNNQNSYQQNQ
jgi:hypothetical protein